jgi:hypothetical protein
MCGRAVDRTRRSRIKAARVGRLNPSQESSPSWVPLRRLWCAIGVLRLRMSIGNKWNVSRCRVARISILQHSRMLRRSMEYRSLTVMRLRSSNMVRLIRGAQKLYNRGRSFCLLPTPCGIGPVQRPVSYQTSWLETTLRRAVWCTYIRMPRLWTRDGRNLYGIFLEGHIPTPLAIGLGRPSGCFPAASMGPVPSRQFGRRSRADDDVAGSRRGSQMATRPPNRPG